MAALRPLPDHRPAVLLALDTLGARNVASGCSIGTIGDEADLDAGQAWLAVTQCAHAGLVAHNDDGLLRDDRGGRTWSLTRAGRDAVDALNRETDMAPAAATTSPREDVADRRARFAGQAMMALLSRSDDAQQVVAVCAKAWMVADAMLAEQAATQ